MEKHKALIAGSLLCILLTACGNPVSAGEVPTVPEVTKAVTVPTETAPEPVAMATEPEEEPYVPGNETDYDRQFTLGSASMGWNLGDWMFKLGGKDAGPTGITLSHEFSGTEGLVSLEIEPRRYLEVWDGSLWQAFGQFEEEGAMLDVDATEAEVTVRWEEPLPPGYYRVGAYYRAVMASGEEYRQMCYVKLRILEEDSDALVKLCQQALQAVKDAESCHVLRTDYLLQQKDDADAHYYTSEVFKAGDDCYREAHYYFHASGEEKSARAELYRNGEGKSWNSMKTPQKAWEPADYLDTASFESWAYFLDCQTDTLEHIFREGNIVTTVIPNHSDVFHQDIVRKELVYTFDDAGTLREIRLDYVFTDERQETEVRLEVKDTSPKEIRRIIHDQ